MIKPISSANRLARINNVYHCMKSSAVDHSLSPRLPQATYKNVGLFPWVHCISNGCGADPSRSMECTRESCSYFAVYSCPVTGSNFSQGNKISSMASFFFLVPDLPDLLRSGRLGHSQLTTPFLWGSTIILGIRHCFPEIGNFPEKLELLKIAYEKNFL